MDLISPIMYLYLCNLWKIESQQGYQSCVCQRASRRTNCRLVIRTGAYCVKFLSVGELFGQWGGGRSLGGKGTDQKKPGEEKTSLHVVSWPTNYNHSPDRMGNADLVGRCVWGNTSYERARPGKKWGIPSGDGKLMGYLIVRNCYLQQVESARKWPA